MYTIDVNVLGVEPGQVSVDVGCGQGRHCYYLERAGALATGLDLSQSDLLAARHQMVQGQAQSVADGKQPPAPEGKSDDDKASSNFIRASATRLPLADGSVDAVICSEVLEHLADYQGAISELARVLRINGRLGISVPRFIPEWLCWKLEPQYPYAPGGHIRIFKQKQLIRIVEQKGFKLLAVSHAHGLHSPYWWLQCVLWEKRHQSGLVAAYRRFLEWDLFKQPLLTRILASIADPLMGKSLVLYFERCE